MSFKVYKIDTFPGGSNSYGVDRSENWYVKKDSAFDTLKEARDYIISKNMLLSDLPLYTHAIQDDDARNKVINDFCFDDPKFAAKRRFWLGKPNVEEMKKALAHDGVKILNT